MIHLSPWQTAPWPEQVDCVITDPPYSERTHSGQRSHYNGKAAGGGRRELTNRPLSEAYHHLTPAQVTEWAAAWAPRVRYWLCVMCDHTLIPDWHASLQAAGLYAFQPVPIIRLNPSPRFAGDGPASGAVYMMTARTKAGAKWGADSWGSLPGHYETIAAQLGKGSRIGGKPIPLMQQIIRDYSRPEMLVADPCAGHGTTLVAAKGAGRLVWGAERDPAAHRAACERLDAVQVPTLIPPDRSRQSNLL
jgi:hypothetical protein